MISNRRIFVLLGIMAVAGVLSGVAYLYLDRSGAQPIQLAEEDSSAQSPVQTAAPGATRPAPVPQLQVEQPDVPQDSHPILTPDATCILDQAGPLAALSVHQPDGKNLLIALGESPGEMQLHELDFIPTRTQIARSPNGEDVLLAASNLRRNQLVYRPEGIEEPLSIYHNGARVFHSNKVLNFNLAEDGSAFFVVEPLSELTARLIIRDFEQGTEVHHDLGMSYFSIGFDVPGVHFTPKGDEVYVIPVSGGDEPIRFYANNSETMQEIYIPNMDNVTPREWFYSSDVFYENVVTQLPETNQIAVHFAKRVRNPDGDGFNTPWQQPLDADSLHLKVGFSPDRGVMAILGYGLYVFDSHSGKLKFHMPTVGGLPEERAHLTQVDPRIDDPDYDLPAVDHFEFVGDELHLYRRYGEEQMQACGDSPLGDDECERDLARRGILHRTIDVFPLDGLNPDTKATRRLIKPEMSDNCENNGQIQIERALHGELHIKPWAPPETFAPDTISIK